TPANNSAFLRHRLWLIKNRPRMTENDIFGLWFPSFIEDGLPELRTAWLDAVAAAKSDSKVRLNAIDFLMFNFPDDAEKMVAEGITIFPTEYKYPLLMSNIALRTVKKDWTAEQKKPVAKKTLEYGRAALALIKKERSTDRDSDRRDLLKELASAAIAADELDAAALFATELILDFGKSIDDVGYDDATHIGNVALGRVELRKGNIDRAKEYLLIAIHAPLRSPRSSLYPIDMRLAKELYEKGVKAEVLEFLRLCLDLNQFKTSPDANEDEIKAIKRWREQIGKGVTPSFDFYAP
ncbi:MAG TPA: hypothetical protein VJV05_00130, partial [Pyrinomonadaceae bacterium]|nr:hypothetical protein [Pyrinomonadaceae bacterium]